MTTEENFYFKIGMIAVEFSNLENHIRELIGLFINSDDEFINLLLTEENGIYQNLKLLIKLSKFRSIQEEEIKILNKSIDKLRINRNLFIHGLWTKHVNKDNEILFICEMKRVEFKKGTYGVSKYMNKFLEFKLEDFEKEIVDIKACLEIMKRLLKSVKNEI